MKETEKLDLILRAFYNFRNQTNPTAIVKLCNDHQIPIENNEERSRLVKELEGDGFIKLAGSTGVAGKITSKGIQYCEESSFGNPGYAIIYNISTINGNDNILIVNSSGITIDKNATTEILNKILHAIQNDSDITKSLQKEMIDQLKELQNTISAKGDPSNSLLKLLSVGANVASIGSLLFELLKAIKPL